MLTSQFCGCFSYLHLWPINLSDFGASLSTVFLRALGEWCILWGHSQSHNPLMDLLFRLTHFAQPLYSFLYSRPSAIQTFLTLLRMGFPWTLGSDLVCAAITEDHSLSDLNNKLYFSRFWKPESPRLRCLQIWCLGRAHFLFDKQLSLCCVFTWWKGRASCLGPLTSRTHSR